MQLESLEYRTDLMFWGISGRVVDRGAYVLVDSPERRGWYYGNLLIFPRPPEEGDFELWHRLFAREFGRDERVRHVLFGWENDRRDPSGSAEFVEEGFELDSSVTLVATEVRPPPHPNPDIDIRAIEGDWEWEQVIGNMIDDRDARFARESYTGFIRRSVQSWRALIRRGLGTWYGAWIGDQLVGDLGLFVENGIGRFQSVSTVAHQRRRGICGTLVHAVSSVARRSGVRQLVMVADEEYIAASIYESVGFRRVEQNGSLLLYPPDER